MYLRVHVHVISQDVARWVAKHYYYPSPPLTLTIEHHHYRGFKLLVNLNHGLRRRVVLLQAMLHVLHHPSFFTAVQIKINVRSVLHSPKRPGTGIDHLRTATEIYRLMMGRYCCSKTENYSYKQLHVFQNRTLFRRPFFCSKKIQSIVCMSKHSHSGKLLHILGPVD